MKNDQQEKDVKSLIENDPDYVHYPTLDNSLKRVLEIHPDGLTEEKIAKALMMTEKEVKKTLDSILLKLRQSIGEEDENG